MIKKFIFPLLFFLISNTSYAKQVNITSDKLEIVRTDNVSIFSGNVFAFEGDLKIWSGKLIVTSSDDEKTIQKIDAFIDIKIVRDELSIFGNEATYDPIANELIVIGDVKVAQNDNIVFCDELIVDLENSSSIMKSKSVKRVEAIIINKE